MKRILVIVSLILYLLIQSSQAKVSMIFGFELIAPQLNFHNIDFNSKFMWSPRLKFNIDKFGIILSYYSTVFGNSENKSVSEPKFTYYQITASYSFVRNFTASLRFNSHNFHYISNFIINDERFRNIGAGATLVFNLGSPKLFIFTSDFYYPFSQYNSLSGFANKREGSKSKGYAYSLEGGLGYIFSIKKLTSTLLLSYRYEYHKINKSSKFWNSYKIQAPLLSLNFYIF